MPLPCLLPEWPAAPALNIWECRVPSNETDTGYRDAICWDQQSVINLGLWVRAVERYHEAAEVCRGK